MKSESPRNKDPKLIPLKDWDFFILEMLEMEDYPLSREFIFRKARNRVKFLNLEVTDKQLYNKISRSLTKLINNRKQLQRYKYSGYGYVYGLSSWFTLRGELKKKYQEKLTPENF